MTESTNIFQARQYLNGAGLLGNFTPYAQRLALLETLRGEEGEGIAEIVLRVAKGILDTPKTYQTEEIKTADKRLCLHYFKGGVDAWIVERDVGDTPDGDGLGDQYQAYGKISLYGGGWKDAEWGYISIHDLIANGVELDLYWEPKIVKEMK